MIIYSRRQSIKETPCWIEIQIHRALQLLDDLFNSMSHQMTNNSTNPPSTNIKMEPTRPPYNNMDS